jgi:hydroxypyruvate isomerase
MIKYAANVTIAFKEYEFCERFQRASDAGFQAVEFMSPFVYDVEEIVKAVSSSGIKVVQFNFMDGDLTGGQRGHASHPDKVEEWREECERALELSKRMGVRQINSLAGIELDGVSREEQMACLVDNLSWAAPKLKERELPLMLEPLNTYDNKGYLLGTSGEGLAVLDRVNSPWVRLQYDVYHMQRMEGDLVNTIRANIDRIGHVQIADNPGRHEPGTGEIDYRFVLGALDEAGYDGYVGLEYVPSGKTEDSFGWLPKGKRGSSTAEDLNL